MVRLCVNVDHVNVGHGLVARGGLLGKGAAVEELRAVIAVGAGA